MEYLVLNWKDDFVKFNSQDTEYKAPYGAVPCGDKIYFKIKVSKKAMPESVRLHVQEDNKANPNCPHRVEYNMTRRDTPKNTPVNEISEERYLEYTCVIDTPSVPNLLFYYFELRLAGGIIKFYGNNYDELGGFGNVYDSFPKSYQITTYYKNSKTPDWFKKSIIYQIFPDRFFNGNPDGKVNCPKKNSFIYGNWDDKPLYIKGQNGEILRWDFFGGNLLGITKKLDYLKDLGINLIYLNPIFKARSNHRYDTGDYKEIDSMLGTEEDFKTLISEAEARGINIILDGVFNHTGMDSKYFNACGTYNSIGAYSSVGSPYYDWYTFYKHPTDYECWWGVKDLPCVNELSPSFMDYIINDADSVVNKWMKMGIKGWRLDVADELPGPFLKSLRKKCHETDKESILLGEVWEDATNKISYNVRREYMCGEELDSVTNYPFRNYFLDYFADKFDTDKLVGLFERMKENYPKENFYSLVNILGTHDVVRILTMSENVGKTIQDIIYKKELYREKVMQKGGLLRDLEFKILKLIILMQMTFPGIPIIYYGDEAGVRGGADPDNRHTFPWGHEDQNILSWYKKLLQIRNNNDFFSTGFFKQISINEDVYGIARYSHNGTDAFGKPVETKDKFAFTFVNRNPVFPFEVTIKTEDYKDIFKDKNTTSLKSILDNEEIVIKDGEIKFTVEPLGAVMLANKKL